MRGRADAGMAVGRLGGVGAQPGHELRDVVRRQRRLPDDRHRHVGDAADAVEIVHHVVFQVVVEGRRRGMRDVPDGDGVAIGRGARDAGHADRAAGAAGIVDDHGLAERLAHRFGNETRHRVGRTARGRGHNKGDGLVRIALGMGGNGERRGCGKGQRAGEKGATERGRRGHGGRLPKSFLYALSLRQRTADHNRHGIIQIPAIIPDGPFPATLLRRGR